MNNPNGDTHNVTERDIVDFVMDSTRERYQRLSWQGGFSEYLSRVAEDPYKHTRTSYQLMRDMINFFAYDEYEDSGEMVRRYRLFDDPFNEKKNCIYGLERNIRKLVQFIDSAANEQGKERILILHGPVGTAKTSIVDLLARGLEHFTAAPQGEVYTFSWRFGKDFNSEGTGGVGFGASPKADYAGFDNPIAVLPSQMHDHPLLLIPRKERRALLEKMFRDAGIHDKCVIPHKLLEGELDYNSKQIYDFLIRKYRGNWLKVMDHVLVQRAQFSENAGFGIAKIPPEGNVETASQPVTVDENFRYLSNLITSINLVRYFGKYVLGNRGLVHYSDIFKKPASYLQHLLGAVEEHRMDFGETACDIDVVIIGTTNIHEYLALRQDPISKALRSRIRKVDIPYLVNFRDEEKIYNRGLRQFKHRRMISPHTTEMAARWAVRTRLEPSELAESKEFDEGTRAVLAKLTPAMKSMVYAGQFPQELTPGERRKLTEQVCVELRNELKYEGMNGVPTRVLQNVFADLCEADDGEEGITPFRVFDLLEEVVAQGPENHDFLARKCENGWYDSKAFIKQLRDFYDQTLRNEIEDSIVDVDHEEMESRIRTYMHHVTAYNKKETLRNPVTGKDDRPVETLMRQLEDVMEVTDEEREFFRFKLLSRASNAASEGKSVDIRELYKDLFRALHRALYMQKRDSVNWADVQAALEKAQLLKDFEELVQEEGADKHRDTTTLLRNLEATYGYRYECARISVLYFIRSLLKRTAKLKKTKKTS